MFDRRAFSWLPLLFGCFSAWPAEAASISGRMIDGIFGVGAWDATVEAVPFDPPASSAVSSDRSDSDGVFRISGLPTGSYFLLVRPRDDSHLSPHVFGAGSCNLLDGKPVCDLQQATRIEVQSAGQELGPYEATLDEEVEIAGRVLPPFGSPHHFTGTVLLYQADGRLADRWLVPTQIGVNDFEFERKAPGTYYLLLDAPPGWHDVLGGDIPCSRWYCDPFAGRPIVLAPGERYASVLTSTQIAVWTACVPSPEILCLEQGRFRARATWRDFLGQAGPARAVPITDQTGYFYFFAPGNIELMVKALNACTPELGHHFWIFSTGLTDVAFELEVEDTVTGESRIYRNELGNAAGPALDTQAFASCDAPESPPAH